MSLLDFMPTIKGIIIAVVGWTIASIQSFTSYFQVLTTPEAEMWDAWISLAIKAVALVTGIVLLFINLNKLRKQQQTMHIDEDNSGGDNEDGSAGTGPGDSE